MQKKPKTPKLTFNELSEWEKRHVRTVGFESLEPYFKWCKENGFKAFMPKPRGDIIREQLHVSRIKAEAVAIARRATRDPLKLIQRLVENPKENLPGCGLISNALQGCGYSYDQSLMVKVLEHIGNHTDLLNRTYTGNHTYAKGIVNLLRWTKDWIHPIEEWEPKTHNAHRQFSSLIRHLFAKYKIPTFMDKCWFASDSKSQEYQLWFIHLGLGGSVRDLTLPIEYTKKMAHHFMQAPEHYTFEAAIRHGQIIALGGEQRLSETLCSTRIGNNFEHEDFWVTVVRWFIRHPMIDPDQVGPIIDYLQNQRYAERQVRDVNGRPVTLGPESPNLTMKDRDPATLLKEVERWHKMLAGIKHKGTVVTWNHSQYKDWELDMGELYSKNWKRWRIFELLSSTELQRDGREMKHCVYSYVRSCETGRVSVWSMELCNNEGITKQLTIEVRNGTIVQARGKLNARTTPQQQQILTRWAGEQNLGFGNPNYL